jgi:hypothetical protein
VIATDAAFTALRRSVCRVIGHDAALEVSYPKVFRGYRGAARRIDCQLNVGQFSVDASIPTLLVQTVGIYPALKP